MGFSDESEGLERERGKRITSFLSEEISGIEETSPDELCVSFGYKSNIYSRGHECNTCTEAISSHIDAHDNTGFVTPNPNIPFSRLFGAAVSANLTLPNTTVLNGLIGKEILPGLDSPSCFHRILSSPSFSRLDLLSSSQSSMSTLPGSASSDSDFLQDEKDFVKVMSGHTCVETPCFFNEMDLQMAGGAAGEDRAQVAFSEENGWLFCGVYDGFNGRDAADFLAGTLYENIGVYLHLLNDQHGGSMHSNLESSLQGFAEDSDIKVESALGTHALEDPAIGMDRDMFPLFAKEISLQPFQQGVMDCLKKVVAQAENDFLHMVEQEMEDRPDLVCIGSSVLIVLLHGMDLYTLNLGDSRAILAATFGDGQLEVVQLTEDHTVDNEAECDKLLADHPDDVATIVGGKVKGKLKLTRALGVGYLKKKSMNDALMGILRVHNLCSPPYVSTQPFVRKHRVSDSDTFVVIGSDGLFEYFSNNEIVQLVHLFLQNNPSGDPAKYLVKKLLLRAAQKACVSLEELLSKPVERRRKYHDDVTVVIIVLKTGQRTTASTIF